MAASTQSVGNGPRLPGTMYALKPYHSIELEEVPNVIYRMKSYHTDTQSPVQSSLEVLEKRQEDVLKRLEQLQSSASKLAEKYNVQTTSASQNIISSSGMSSTTSKPALTGGSALDLVINVDPEHVPWSLVILCEKLAQQFAVLKTTYVHSSVSCSVPDSMRTLLAANGNGLKRSDSQIVITLVWKKVSNGPQLVVDPVKQTAIIGEVNIARYLARLLSPAYDETDPLSATKSDELLDLAQLQILEGNNKEKSAALRGLNSSLGKQDWLSTSGSGPSLADIVCWSALQQTELASNNPPANVKKWLKLCENHSSFQRVAGLLS